MNGSEELQISRSPFLYVGDKFKLLPQILPLFPKNYDRIVEPFVGGGSVALNAKSKSVLGNDLDQHVIAIHRLLLSNQSDIDALIDRLRRKAREYQLSWSAEGIEISSELKARHPKTYFAQINRSGFEKLKKDYNSSSDRSTEDLFLLMIFGFNRMLRFNRKGDFNIPVGNVDFNMNVVNALRKYAENTSGRSFKFSNLEFNVFFDSHDLTESDFVYADPPYLITASEYNKGWTAKDDINLYSHLDDLNKRGIRFALSNVVKYNDLENEILQDWMSTYQVKTIRSNYINYFDNGKKRIEEVLVRNYE